MGYYPSLVASAGVSISGVPWLPLLTGPVALEWMRFSIWTCLRGIQRSLLDRDKLRNGTNLGPDLAQWSSSFFLMRYLINFA